MTIDDTTVQARVDAATEAALAAFGDDVFDLRPRRERIAAALTAAGVPALLAEVAKAEELRVAAVHLLHFFELNDIFEDGAFNPPTLGEARSRIDRLLRAALATPTGGSDE